MYTRHGAHTIDDYLDDNDFNMLVERIFQYMRSNSYSVLDFDEMDQEDTINVIKDFIADFVEEEACDDFGWKYGEQAGVNRYVSTAENIFDTLKQKFVEVYDNERGTIDNKQETNN